MEWCEDIFTQQDMVCPRHADYLATCDHAFQQLQLKNEIVEFTAEVPTVVAVVRDEARRLPIFLDYYRALGVRAFHVVSNRSTDETESILLKDPGVTLWRTEDSYRDAALGQLWIAAIVRRYGIGKWVLNVDADELLVFPGMDEFGLKDLQAWLTRNSYTRLVAHLIDLYGPHRWHESTSPGGSLFIDKNYVEQAIRQDEHWRECREYKLYKKWLASEGDKPLFDPRVSIPFEGVRTLVELGLISQIDWIIGGGFT